MDEIRAQRKIFRIYEAFVKKIYTYIIIYVFTWSYVHKNL